MRAQANAPEGRAHQVELGRVATVQFCGGGARGRPAGVAPGDGVGLLGDTGEGGGAEDGADGVEGGFALNVDDALGAEEAFVVGGVDVPAFVEGGDDEEEEG